MIADDHGRLRGLPGTVIAEVGHDGHIWAHVPQPAINSPTPLPRRLRSIGRRCSPSEPASSGRQAARGSTSDPPWCHRSHWSATVAWRSWQLVVLLLVNWTSSLHVTAAAPAVSYTFFLSQVSASNVDSITSTGDTIEAPSRSPSLHTARGARQQVERFTTQRPTFANDNLFEQLQTNGVPINANPPDAGPPLWQQLLLGFGPTLLLVWLLLSVRRRRVAAPGASSARSAVHGRRSTARSRATHHVRGRGRHRRGQERGHGDRRLPA